MLHIIAEEISGLDLESILGACDHGHWNTLWYAAGGVQVRWCNLHWRPRTVEHVKTIHFYRHSVETCSVSCELTVVDTVVVV